MDVSPNRRSVRSLLLTAALLIGAAVAAGGCAHRKSNHGEMSAFAAATQISLAEFRSQAMATADTYTTIVAQSVDQLREKTKNPQIVDWALQQRIATAIASYTNATGTNDLVSLLDMLVLTTLKRQALEEYWIPTLLHEEGAPVLDAWRRAENEVWAMGERTLTKAQAGELRGLIEHWRQQNPTQYYVSHIRFTDFVTALKMTSSSPQVKMPGSVFSLLYIDPLAGLDPVAKEISQFKRITERAMYLVARMPITISWQADLAIHRAMTTPQLEQFVASTSKFADATSRFATATTQVANATTQTAAAINRTADNVAKIPQDVSVERKAAIDQLNTVVAAQSKAAIEQTMAGVNVQREAITRDLEAQQGKLQQLVADVKGVVETANEAGLSINTATGQTITTTEQATQRTLQLAFRLGLILIIVLLVGIPLSLLLYRIAATRWAAPAPRTTSL